MDQIPKIPCKDCITFAICRAQIQGNSSYRHILLSKCSLIREYSKPDWKGSALQYSPIKLDNVRYILLTRKEYINYDPTR